MVNGGEPVRNETDATTSDRDLDSEYQGGSENESTGMLFLKLGRKDGIRVGEIARLLCEQGGLDRGDVGRIRVRDRYTFVGVPEEKLDEVLSKLAGVAVNDRPLDAERARVTRS